MSENDEQYKLLYMIMSYFSLLGKTPEDKQRLQKTIYLLISTGMKLGYGFSWYKYGPYSQDLIEDAHRVRMEEDDLEEDTKDYKFSDLTTRELADIKESFKDILQDIDKLELFVSVLFVVHTWDYRNRHKIVRAFRKHKKILYTRNPFTDEEILEAFDRSIILLEKRKILDEEMKEKKEKKEAEDKIKYRMYYI